LPSDAWDAWEQMGRLGKVLTKLGSLLVYQIGGFLENVWFIMENPIMGDFLKWWISPIAGWFIGWKIL